METDTDARTGKTDVPIHINMFLSIDMFLSFYYYCYSLTSLISTAFIHQLILRTFGVRFSVIQAPLHEVMNADPVLFRDV